MQVLGLMMSSDVLFCLIKSLKSKVIQFTVIYETEKHQIITSEKLQLANLCHFALKKTTKMVIQLSIYL